MGRQPSKIRYGPKATVKRSVVTIVAAASADRPARLFA